jgi:hypothetical protein
MTSSIDTAHNGSSAKARISAGKDKLRDLIEEVGRLLAEIRTRHCTATDERFAAMVGDAIARMPVAHAHLLDAVRARVAEIEAHRE